MTRDLSNYSIFFRMNGESPLSLEGPNFVHAETYVLDLPGKIVHEVESEVEGEADEHGQEAEIVRVILNPVGSFSGAKLLAKLARSEGQDVPHELNLYSEELTAALNQLERSGMFKKFFMNIVVLTSMELEPEHDDLEVRLHAIARVVRAVSSDFDLVLVTPVPPQMPDAATWSPEKEGDARLAMSFRRLSENWMLVLSVEGLTFSR